MQVYRTPILTLDPNARADGGLVEVVKLADAQATVEALQAVIRQMGEQAAVLAKDGMAAKAQMEAVQRVRDEFERERDQLHAALMEAITAHRNMVKQFDELTCFIGCDYDPETETWVSGEPPYLSAGTNEVEACKAAVDALRSVAIVLQTALDAEREKGQAIIKDTKNMIDVATRSLWEQLTQLQALVRALPVVKGKFEVGSGVFYYVRALDGKENPVVCGLMTEQATAFAIKALLAYRASLDATTPATTKT